MPSRHVHDPRPRWQLPNRKHRRRFMRSLFVTLSCRMPLTRMCFRQCCLLQLHRAIHMPRMRWRRLPAVSGQLRRCLFAECVPRLEIQPSQGTDGICQSCYEDKCTSCQVGAYFLDRRGQCQPCLCCCIGWCWSHPCDCRCGWVCDMQRRCVMRDMHVSSNTA